MKNDRKATERQLDGSNDLDTTSLDRPSDLSSKTGDLVGAYKGEDGPSTGFDPDNLRSPDPSGEDPFVPGTGEAPDDFDPDSLLSDAELHTRKVAREMGSEGPTYEAHQGNVKEDHGGSVDPNNDLTEDTSGYQKSKPAKTNKK